MEYIGDCYLAMKIERFRTHYEGLVIFKKYYQCWSGLLTISFDVSAPDLM